MPCEMDARDFQTYMNVDSPVAAVVFNNIMMPLLALKPNKQMSWTPYREIYADP